MRFSLQDLQKQVRRRGDELYVSLHFLRPGELHPEIERLIAYHEQMLGQPRRLFVIDEARAAGEQGRHLARAAGEVALFHKA